MKTTFTSHEIAHIWAHKSAPYGKSPGAVSFDGPVICSYSTAIARHIEHKGKPAIILNTTSYSVSTSKHQSRVWQAIGDVPTFEIGGMERGTSLSGVSGKELFAYAIKEAAEAAQRATKARVRKSWHEAAQARWLSKAQEINTFFGLRRKVDSQAIERLRAASEASRKRAAAEQAKRDAAERAKQVDSYEAWKRGEDFDYGFHPSLFPIAFRVEIRNGEQELVSTLGARVPLRAAQVAYRFAMSKRGQDWRENGETCPVGHYRLNAINEHGIVAGCHRITWAELERLAPVLSGETVNA